MISNLDHHTIQRAHCTLTRSEYRPLVRQAAAARLSPTAYLKTAAFAYMEQRYLYRSS